MARARYMALLLSVAALAVVGCGGKDDSGSRVSAAGGASGQQGATGLTGASGATGTTDAGHKRTGKSKQKSGKKGGADRGNTGQGTTGSAAPAKPSPSPSTPPPSKTTSSTLTPEQLKQLRGGMYKQARFLCKASTLQGLAHQYGIKSADPDAVAKAYAAPFPLGLRKEVTAGCKAGLLESK